MKITFLGTSASLPIPYPGCACPQCAEARAKPALRRTRSSLLVEAGGEVVLVDPGPDVLHQLEREGLPPRVDRVLVTHTHVDHCLGLDDLVRMRADPKAPLCVQAAGFHRKRLAEIFPDLLEEHEPKIRLEVWKPGSQIPLEGVVLEGFETGHRAHFPTTGVLLHLEMPDGVRRVAYATDVGDLPDESLERLEDITLLVGDGTYLGDAGPGHPGTDHVLRVAGVLSIERVAFTHIGHVQVDDATLREHLGPEIGLAYDGGDLLELLPAED